MEYIPRYLEDVVLETHRTFKVLYVGGPRQVGKTTILRHLAERIGVVYVTLDDRNVRELAQRDPQLFLDQYQTPLFIDEVQYAPGLFSEIKLRVDLTDERGQYWLTGSEQFSMMSRARESLAGRVGILTLLGLSHAEIARREKIITPFSLEPRVEAPSSETSIAAVFEEIVRGAFPALYQPNAPALQIFYSSYLQTYIERDIAQLFHVSKLANFELFLQLCAARTGQVLNMSDLARDAGISTHAASEWISILESSRQIYLLRPYFANISKRLIKAPKLYFLDTGLAAYLTRWTNAETLRAGAMAGAFFETFAIAQIIKSYLFRGIEPPISYLRDKDGHEVDLLIESGSSLTPIEIKRAATITEADIAPTRFWRKELDNLASGAIISAALRAIAFDSDTRVIPVTDIS